MPRSCSRRGSPIVTASRCRSSCAAATVPTRTRPATSRPWPTASSGSRPTRSSTSSARRRPSTSRWCSPSRRWRAGWCRRPRRCTCRSAACSAPDRKMLKSRDRARRCGSSTSWTRPIERGAGRGRREEPGAPDRAAAAIGRAVGIGAVKYADLSSDRVGDYVFELGAHALAGRLHGAVPAVRARPDPLDLPPRRRRGRACVDRPDARRRARASPCDRAAGLSDPPSASRSSG